MPRSTGVVPGRLEGGMVDGHFIAGDYTVIVVDPDVQLCAELTALLERAGFKARAFHSAEAALPAIGEYTGQLCIIAELELPGMTGLELIARLRHASITAPVVILTRSGDVATAVRAMRDSVSDYLVKPYVERDLINRVRSALLRQRNARR